MIFQDGNTSVLATATRKETKAPKIWTNQYFFNKISGCEGINNPGDIKLERIRWPFTAKLIAHS